MRVAERMHATSKQCSFMLARQRLRGLKEEAVLSWSNSNTNAPLHLNFIIGCFGQAASYVPL